MAPRGASRFAATTPSLLAQLDEAASLSERSSPGGLFPKLFTLGAGWHTCYWVNDANLNKATS